MVPHTRLADVFSDAPYNRTNFLLVSSSADELAAAAVALSRAALQVLDLRQHDATHPRLGIVDHISCQPVGPDAQLSEAADVARSIGQVLQDSLPVFLYGAAHPQQRTLADIRRTLGYFQGAKEGRWAANQGLPAICEPDLGPVVIEPRHGVAAIGASGWVTNVNVPLATADVQAARGIARAVSARGGGLPFVEAMALPHTDGTEIACNLLDDAIMPADSVIAEVRRLATAAGLPMGAAAYVLGATREELLRPAHLEQQRS